MNRNSAFLTVCVALTLLVGTAIPGARSVTARSRQGANTAQRASSQIEPQAGTWHTWVLQSGSQLRLSGTSVSAPVAARCIANGVASGEGLFAPDGKGLYAATLRERLSSAGTTASKAVGQPTADKLLNIKPGHDLSDVA